jgi:hypothetical protein
MQFGSTINPALGRTDYSAYTQGAAQGAQAIGQGMQQLGQGIGAAIKQYRMEQEKKDQEASAEQAVASFAIQNPEEAKQIGLTDPTDKKLVKHLVKSFGGAAPTFQVINQFSQMKQQKEEFGMKQAAFESAQATERAAQQQSIERAALAMATNRIVQGYAPAEGTPQHIIDAANIAARQIRGGQAKSDAELSKTIAETKAISAPKPISGFSFKNFDDAKNYLGNKYNGVIKPDPTTGGVIIEGISPRADIDQSKTNLPQGMRLNAKGEAEWIPGTPGATEQADTIQKSQQYIQKTIETTDNILETIDEAKGYAKSGIGAVGAAAPLMSKIGNTDARALAARINTIKSSLGLDKLNEMKQASKTGASGLGGVAVAELQALQGSIAELDQAQSDKAFFQSLSKIERHYKNWRSTVTDKEYYSPSQKQKPSSGAEAMWGK